LCNFKLSQSALPHRSSASALSGSANRGDFSRIMQLEVVDSPRKISNLYFTWRNLVVRLYLKYGVSLYKRTT
ncbi:hypothetical protein HMPREF1582_01370, partial [Gardnerella vaginalis JCP8151A]